MALTSLRYLQDDQDPLNALLAGGGQPSVPDPQTDPAGEQQPQPADDTPANPYRGELEQSLLNAPPPAAKGGDYIEPMPVKMRDSYAQPGAAAPERGVSKDPELDAAYRSAQMDALQHAKFDDKGYGVAEGLRDNGAALLASILDIGFNKGRGLGGIVGATAQEVGRQADSREKERKAAQDFALAARKQHDDGLGQQRLDYLYASLANKEKSQEGAQGRFDARRNDVNDPNSQRNTTAQQQAFTTALARGQGTQEATHQYNPTIATDRANIAGAEAAASTGARIGTEHDNAPITRQDAAALAAAQQGARIQTDLSFAPQTTAAAAGKAGAEAAARVGGERAGQSANRPVPPGFEEADAATFANVNQDPNARNKMLADTQAARQLTDASSSLAALRQQNGPQWLPSQDSGEYQALHLAVVGAANRAIADAGTLNAGERELIQQYVPGANPNWKDLVGWMTDTDLNGQQLEGFAKGLQQVLNSRVASYGLRSARSDAPPSAAAAMPQVRGGGPPPVPEGDTLSIQPLPPKPSSEGRPVRTIVNVKTGRPTQTMMTDAELAPAIQSGVWRLGN